VSREMDSTRARVKQAARRRRNSILCATVAHTVFAPSANSATTCGLLVPLLPKARPPRPQPAQPVPPAPSPPRRPRPAAQGRSAPSEPSTPPKPPLTWPKIPATIPPTPQHPTVPARPRFAGQAFSKRICGRGWLGFGHGLAAIRESATPGLDRPWLARGCVGANARAYGYLSAEGPNPTKPNNTADTPRATRSATAWATTRATTPAKGRPATAG
jgi:hypothetical protein